jgi:hypothetical protein
MLRILRLSATRALICIPLAPSLHKFANATHAGYVFRDKNSPSSFNTPHGVPDGLPVNEVYCSGRAIVFALPIFTTILIMHKGINMSLNSGGHFSVPHPKLPRLSLYYKMPRGCLSKGKVLFS